MWQRDVKYSSPLIAQPDLTELMNQISAQFPWNYEARQSVLECRTLTEMYETELQLLLTELEVISRETRVSDEGQRRRWIKISVIICCGSSCVCIREELGEENPVSDADEIEGTVEEDLKASVEVKEQIRKEINRFQNMPDWTVRGCGCDPRLYLETLLELPWNKMSEG